MSARNKVWTAKDIPDQTGRIIVITGGNSGLGLQSAKYFAQANARVIIACRSEDKAKAAVAEINAVKGSKGKVEYVLLDLESLASIRAFADSLDVDHIDVLMNNAGIMMVAKGKTKDGFERQMGTNVIGHFALTGLLLPRLLASQGQARIVNLSSFGARNSDGPVFLDDLHSTKSYSPAKAYGNTKLAEHWFTRELNRRAEAAGVSDRLLALVAHPGWTSSNLLHGMAHGSWFMAFLSLFMAQNVKIGALPQVIAAVDPDAQPLNYYGPSGTGGFGGNPTLVAPPKHADDAAAAEKLWRLCEEDSKVQYPTL